MTGHREPGAGLRARETGRQTLRSRAPGTVKPQARSNIPDRAPCPQPRQPGGTALDKAWTVLGDTAWGGGTAWRAGPVEPWGGDAGCRVGVRGGGVPRGHPGTAWAEAHGGARDWHGDGAASELL